MAKVNIKQVKKISELIQNDTIIYRSTYLNIISFSYL